MGRKSWLRELVIADLQTNGPVLSEKGQAIHRLRERVGHHSSMSVGNIVRLLEAEGNLVRIGAKDGEAPRDPDGNPSPHVRRTYSLALTDEFVATLPPIEETPAPTADVPDPVAPVVDPPGGSDVQLPDGVDYDLLCHTILGVVFNNMAASEEVEELRGVRQELAQAHTALAEAKQVIAALGAELNQERKHRGKVEDEARQLSLDIDTLRAELKAAHQTGVDAATTGRYELRDIVNERSAKAFDQIMRAVPTARG